MADARPRRMGTNCSDCVAALERVETLCWRTAFPAAQHSLGVLEHALNAYLEGPRGPPRGLPRRDTEITTETLWHQFGALRSALERHSPSDVSSSAADLRYALVVHNASQSAVVPARAAHDSA